jgi:hypothetical protein
MMTHLILARLALLSVGIAVVLATLSIQRGLIFLFVVNCVLFVILSGLCIFNYHMAGKL